jgi:hypothetical protein
MKGRYSVQDTNAANVLKDAAPFVRRGPRISGSKCLPPLAEHKDAARAKKAVDDEIRKIKCIVCRNGDGTLLNFLVEEADQRGKPRIVKKKKHAGCKAAREVLG